MKTYYRDLADTAPTALTNIDGATGAPAVLDFWIISDLHLGHERLERGLWCVLRWVAGCR